MSSIFRSDQLGLLGLRCLSTDEINLVEMHEPAETRFMLAIDGPELTRPVAKALLEAHLIQRKPAE